MMYMIGRTFAFELTSPVDSGIGRWIEVLMCVFYMHPDSAH